MGHNGFLPRLDVAADRSSVLASTAPRPDDPGDWRARAQPPAAPAQFHGAVEVEAVALGRRRNLVSRDGYRPLHMFNKAIMGR